MRSEDFLGALGGHLAQSMESKKDIGANNYKYIQAEYTSAQAIRIDEYSKAKLTKIREKLSKRDVGEKILRLTEAFGDKRSYHPFQ